MLTIDSIKKGIKTLYETDPKIHVNISISHPKLNLQNDPVTIKGVYPNVFSHRGIQQRLSQMPHFAVYGCLHKAN